MVFGRRRRFLFAPEAACTTARITDVLDPRPSGYNLPTPVESLASMAHSDLDESVCEFHGQAQKVAMERLVQRTAAIATAYRLICCLIFPIFIIRMDENLLAACYKKRDILCHVPSKTSSAHKTKEDQMSKKIIEGAAMGHTWTSYI